MLGCCRRLHHGWFPPHRSLRFVRPVFTVPCTSWTSTSPLRNLIFQLRVSLGEGRTRLWLTKAGAESAREAERREISSFGVRRSCTFFRRGESTVNRLGKSPEERLASAMVEAGVDPTAETRSVVRSLWLPEDASRHRLAPPEQKPCARKCAGRDGHAYSHPASFGSYGAVKKSALPSQLARTFWIFVTVV